MSSSTLARRSGLADLVLGLQRRGDAGDLRLAIAIVEAQVGKPLLEFLQNLAWHDRGAVKALA
jgi:hypothetical protein